MAGEKGNEKEVTFEIEEELGVICEENSGWRKELNRVAWNGGAWKYDIRSWNSNHTKMNRGITLKAEEMSALKKLIVNMDFEKTSATKASEGTQEQAG